ncbi:MAG TPA: hypothetical protein VE152_13975, partial [Acidimicrobiales bacterium]|nr:hypothetical protein [Acidimicrobiales bacterium]
MGEFPANGDATGDSRGRSDLEATGPSVPDTAGAGGLDRRQEDATPDPVDLDLLSASLRADASDTETFFEVLSKKLVAALGERVSLEREGGLFRRDHRVREISVEL